jgi:hypothetical protein
MRPTYKDDTAVGGTAKKNHNGKKHDASQPDGSHCFGTYLRNKKRVCDTEQGVGKILKNKRRC